MKYSIIFFGYFLLNGCGCVEYNYEDGYPKLKKKITIINHTNKTYPNNALYSLRPIRNSAWGLNYYSDSDYEEITYQRLNRIGRGTVHKNQEGKALELGNGIGCRGKNVSKEAVFLCSLDGGKTKIFFGAYNYHFKRFWGEPTSDCKRHVIKYDVHPVWQEKELTIHIHNDKITFSDPKIKEVKKLKLTINGKKPEEVDPNTLELVDCSKE